MVTCMAKVNVTLIGSGETAGRPWISQLAKDFALTINIVKTSVEPDYGWMQVELDGPVEEIQRATAWLMTTGLHVEADQRAVGA